MLQLDGKIAIVTGAGSGIGKSIATLFAGHGAHVVALDRDDAAVTSTLSEILAAGGRAQSQLCDVTDELGVRRCFEAVYEEHGRLDILVTSAGVSHIGNVEQTSEADFDRVLAVNVRGVYHCLRSAVGIMKRTGGGAILNIASIASVVGIADRFAYSASKGAVLTMTLSVATDYVAQGIRCNCVLPARIHTPFVDGYLTQHYPGREREMFDKLSHYQPIGRMGTPDEVARLSLYLCSDDASFVTGSAFPIDGGVLGMR